MSHRNLCTLTPRDYARLDSMLNREGGHATPRADAVRRKLSTAVIVNPDRLAPEVATLGSLLRFRVDGNAPIERVIVADPTEAMGHPPLFAWTERGLALLGLAAGR